MKTLFTHLRLSALLIALISLPVLFPGTVVAQNTPPNADSDAECGDDCWDLFSWSRVQDGAGEDIPGFGEGLAQDNNCTTTIEAAVEYTGPDDSPNLQGTTIGANNQGSEPWTDEYTLTFAEPLTAPVFDFDALLSDSEVTVSDCNGSPISLTDISTGDVITGGVFSGNDEVQLSGTYDCVVVTISNDRNDTYTFSVGTCLSSVPVPPCADCGDNQEFEYISLVNSEGSGTGATADVELNNVIIGSAEVLFSDLDVSEDLSGSAFGAFDDDGGNFLLAIEFCQPISVQQLDVLGLESESIAAVGTSISGSGAAAQLSGLNLTQCGGSNTMVPTGGSVTNTNPRCSNQGSGNYTVDNQMVETLYFKYTNPVGGCSFDKATFRIGTCVSDAAEAVPVCPLTYITYATDIESYVNDGPDFTGADANAFQVMRDANGNFFDQDCGQIENDVLNGNAIPTTPISPCAEVVDEEECSFCEPTPPCNECPVDSEYEYISLENATDEDGDGLESGDIFIDGVLAGTFDVVFSDVDVNEDVSGTQFGAFDNDGGAYILRLDFCEEQLINQLDIRGLEVESQASVGTMITGTGAGAVLSGQTLTFCEGSDRMNDDDITNGNVVTTAGPGCGANPDASYTLDATPVSTLYFKYVNPEGGCSYDRVGFRIGICTGPAPEATPVCPVTLVTLTTDIEDFVANGATNDNSFQIVQDAAGNLFDIDDCEDVEDIIAAGEPIPVANVSPCAEVVDVEDCSFCGPPVPCVECPADAEYAFIELRDASDDDGDGLEEGNVYLDDVLVGQFAVEFSDVAVNEDVSGTQFGAFDNDGGAYVLRFDFCEDLVFNQLDIRGLEVESQVSVGTAITGVGADAVLSGQTLTFCDGSDRMDADDITNGNTVTTAGPGCGANPNASYTLDGTPTSTLYFKYLNPEGGCRFDYVGFRLGVCVEQLPLAVPTCPLFLFEVDEFPEDDTNDPFNVLQDGEGNFYAINDCPTELPTAEEQIIKVSACATVTQTVECPVCVLPGLAKAVTDVVPAASGIAGNVDVTYTFTLTNFGGAEMTNLQINDDISSIPGFVGITTGPMVVSVDADGVAPTVAGAYAGAGNLLSGSDGSLNDGENLVVTVVAEFDASEVSGTNTATGGGTASTGDRLFLDDSDTGLVPNQNDEPEDTDEPSQQFFPNINVAKSIASFDDAASGNVGNVDVVFALEVCNTGNVSLDNLTLTDDLDAQLGSTFVGVVSPVSIVGGNATMNPGANADFDGDGEVELFNGTSGLLEAGQCITVNFTVEIDPDAQEAVPSNQANAGGRALNPATGEPLTLDGSAQALVVSDDSDAGTDPDGANPGQTGDTGSSDDPLPLILPNPLTVKAIVGVDCAESGAEGNLNVTYEVIVLNAGNTDLSNFSLEDNLSDASAFVATVEAPLIVAESANGPETNATTLPTTNAGFNASGDDLLAGGGELTQGELFVVRYTIELTADEALTNQVLAGADGDVTGPDGSVIRIFDLSDSGFEVQSDNAGRPGDTGGNDDPTPLTDCFDRVSDNIACIGEINLTADENCNFTLIASMVVPDFEEDCEGDALFPLGGYYDLSVIINGDTLVDVDPSTPDEFEVLRDGISTGDEVHYMVTNVFTKQSCWGIVNVEDKTAPTVAEQVAPIDLLCVDLDDNRIDILPNNVDRCYEVFSVDGSTVPGTMATALRNALSAEVGNSAAIVPLFTDGCTERLEVCVTESIAFDGDDPQCNDVVLTRTFTAREILETPPPSGEENEGTSSSYVITFSRPDLDDLDADNIEDVAEYDECGVTTGTIAEIMASYPAPRATDFPFLVVGDRSFPLMDGEAVCNIGVTFADGQPIITCPNTYKFVRTYTVIDWCDPSDVRTFTQVVKVGDTEAPTFSGPTQDRDFDGVVDGDLIFSTNAGNQCAAYIVLDGPGVAATDNCEGAITITAQIYPGGDLTASPIGPFVVDLTDGNAEVTSPIPVGTHLLRYTYEDVCGNADFSDFEFTVEDGTAPVAICEDGLNISITSGQTQGGGASTGIAILTPEMIDAGSYDDCSGITLEIARVNGNNVATEAYDQELVLTCADLGIVRVGLKVTDAEGNMNFCWLDVLVEDKNAPTCLPPGPVALTCVEYLAAGLPADINEASEDELNALFGSAVGIDNCEVTITSMVSGGVNSCGVGSLMRSFVATDGEGFVDDDNCEQFIDIRGVFDYRITFPTDEVFDECVDPDFNQLGAEEFACDLITTNVTMDTIAAVNAPDACYTLRVNYDVINFCEYNQLGECYRIPRDGDGIRNPDTQLLYLNVIPNNTANTGDDIAFLSRFTDRNYNPGAPQRDQLVDDGDDNDGSDDDNSNDSEDQQAANGVGFAYAQDDSRGYFCYVQFVDVYDEVAPTIEGDEPEECFAGTSADCTAEVELTFTADDNCTTPVVTVELDADYNVNAGFIPVNPASAGVSVSVSNDGINYTVNASNVPVGNHAIRIRANDGCGNFDSEIIEFCVEGDKAPTPICIQTLTVTLMPDGNGGGMAEIWASDFIASDVEDCFGNVIDKYSIYTEEEAGAAGFEPQVGDLGLDFTCDDYNGLGEDNTVPVRVYAIADNGTADYCSVIVDVQAFQEGVCGDGGGGGNLAGTILTQDEAPIVNVEVSLSDDGDMDRMVMTAANGAYTFGDLPQNVDYTVQPTYGVGVNLSNVTVADVNLMGNVILGIDQFATPYDYLAADTDRDQQLTVGDMVTTQRIILGLEDNFAISNWGFVPADVDVSNPYSEAFPEVFNANDLVGTLVADFVGYELGNVNAANRSSASIEVEDAQLEAGQTHTLTIAAGDLLGFQGTLELAAGLEVMDVRYDGAGGVNLREVASGAIPMMFLADGMVEVDVRATAAGQLSELVTMTSGVTIAEGVNANGTAGPLSLAFVTSSAPATAPELFQNTPNPVVDVTTIRFRLTEATLAVLTLRDAAGRLLREQQVDGIAGMNRVEIADLTTTGVISYTLTAGEFSATRKMVVVR